MAESNKKGSLGEILAACRIISESDVDAALEEQRRTGCRIGEALVNLGIVAQEDIDWALSNQLDLPYIRLKKEMIDPEAIALIPGSLARTHNFIPLIVAGGEMNIAIADPLNRAAGEAIERLTGLGVNISVALIREIREMIDAWYGAQSPDQMGFESPAFSPAVLETINADITGGKLLDYLLVFILRNRLSSLSMHPSGERVAVSGRRGGVVSRIGTLLLNHYPDFIRRLRKGASIAATGEPAASGTFSLVVKNRTVSFHVALLQGYGGDCVTLKHQTVSSIPARLTDLEVPREQKDAIALLAGASKGITFFASGTIQERCQIMDLMLEENGTAGKNVIILGDGPGRAEGRFPRIPLPESDTDRARLIMDTLDHDPDILVIEDVAGGLPFTAACRAAMRGKLVLAGLDINTTTSVLRHLLHCRQQNYFLPMFVNGLVSVKSVQLLCRSCRKEYVPPREQLAAMRLKQVPDAFYHSAGCDSCGTSGFSARHILLDVLVFDEEFRNAFEQAADVAALEQYLQAKGYCGMHEEGLRLLAAGEIAPEEYIASLIM